MRTPALVSIVIALHVLAVGAFVFIQGCESIRRPPSTTVEPPPAREMPPPVRETTAGPTILRPSPGPRTPDLPVEGATHEVAKGETLSHIAKRYGISWRELAEYNGIENTDMLKVGQKLIIPPYAKKPTPSASSARAPAPVSTTPPVVGRTEPGTYLVQAGDNLTRIARKHGVTIGDLRAANQLQGDMIRVGDKLTIPASGAAAAAPPPDVPITAPTMPKTETEGTTTSVADMEIEPIEIDDPTLPSVTSDQGTDLEYIVMDGDTLDEIAKLFIVSKQSLIDYNGLRPDQELKVGDVIKIPAFGSLIEATMARPGVIKTTSILIGAVLILLALGVVMLASTSVIEGEDIFGDPNHFLKRQVVWMALGLIAGFLVSRFDYRYWKKLAVPMGLFSVALLAMVLVPGVGITIKGSTRWLPAGPVNFQPSELAKLASIVILAWWMAQHQRQALEFGRGLVVPIGMLGVFCLLILMEPDFGTTMLIGVVGLGIMFLGGTRIGYLLVTGLGGMAALGLMIAHDPERRGRILAFLNPEKYADDEAFQLMQALYAFVVGGARGVGLGQSMQKRNYLPEAHTDFILAIIGEELGFGATLLVVLLFVAVLGCGFFISMKTPDRFARLLSFGITLTLSAQAMLNIGVVTGALPTKGIPLPFISFGGSSLVMSLAMVGILVNIARQTTDDFGDEERRIIKDRAHHL